MSDVIFLLNATVNKRHLLGPGSGLPVVVLAVGLLCKACLWQRWACSLEKENASRTNAQFVTPASHWFFLVQSQCVVFDYLLTTWQL